MDAGGHAYRDPARAVARAGDVDVGVVAAIGELGDEEGIVPCAQHALIFILGRASRGQQLRLAGSEGRLPARPRRTFRTAIVVSEVASSAADMNRLMWHRL